MEFPSGRAARFISLGFHDGEAYSCSSLCLSTAPWSKAWTGSSQVSGDLHLLGPLYELTPHQEEADLFGVLLAVGKGRGLAMLTSGCRILPLVHGKEPAWGRSQSWCRTVMPGGWTPFFTMSHPAHLTEKISCLGKI